MPTRSRKKRMFPFYRLAEAIGMPGIDPRTWVAMARVDDDPDAISVVPGLGWLVDVTFQGGALSQVGPVTCRMAHRFAGPGASASDPISPDCEVLVGVPSGDPNDTPMILGQVHNGDGCEFPTEVNEEEITEAFALGTHFVRSPHNVQEQYDGDRGIAARNQALTAEIEFLIEAAVKAAVSSAVLELEGTVSATLKGLAVRIEGGAIVIAGGSVVIVPPAGGGAAAIQLGGTVEFPPTNFILKGTDFNAAFGGFLVAFATFVTALGAIDPVHSAAAGPMATATAALAAALPALLSNAVLVE